MSAIAWSVLLATVPAVLLAAVTWRVVWPRWKLVVKLLLHPCLYLGLALLIGYWSVPVAWVHQGLGLGGHIWFSKKHGFTWYAVEDPVRYVALSRASVDALRAKRSDSSSDVKTAGAVVERSEID